VWRKHHKKRTNTAEPGVDTLAVMTRKKPDDDLLDMAEQLQAAAGGRGRRSPQFQWLFKRAAVFDRMLAELQPSWASVAEAFKRLGITDGAGKHPTGERTRKTWTEVRRAKGWLDKPDVPPPRVTAPGPEAAASRPISKPPDRPPAPFDEPPARTFGTGRLRGHPGTVPPATATVRPPSRAQPPDPIRAAEVVAELMKGAPTNRFQPDDGE
jgi:hypothetical protein